MKAKYAREIRRAIREARADVDRHVTSDGRKLTARLKMRYALFGSSNLAPHGYLQTFIRLSMDRGVW